MSIELPLFRYPSASRGPIGQNQEIDFIIDLLTHTLAEPLLSFFVIDGLAWSSVDNSRCHSAKEEVVMTIKIIL
ncbi:MAG: hypothetical protein ACI97A_003648 [Planctomycetota bacterium]|jgi:hypothetical protein